MVPDISLQEAKPRTMAAVRRRVRVGEVARAWRPALDEVWAFLGERPGLRTDGHNVFLYHHAAEGDAFMDVDFGVEVSRPFEGVGGVRAIATPGGRVVSALHHGPYDRLRETHDAIHAWAASHQLRFAGASWEIYGDPTPDPAKTETRIEYLVAPCLHVIAAVARNGVIGAGGKMPWHLSEDLKRFKQLTLGHPVIMGRKTWDAIGRPLPGRENIVVSRSAGPLEGAVVVRSLDEAISHVAARSDVFVIGGAEIYAQAIPRADVLDLTLLDREFEGDTRFPEMDRAAWSETGRELRVAPDGMAFAFMTYERRR